MEAKRGNMNRVLQSTRDLVESHHETDSSLLTTTTYTLERAMTDVSHFAPGPSVLPSASESRQSLQRMIAVIAKTQGYDGIQSSAMAYILNNLEKCESH